MSDTLPSPKNMDFHNDEDSNNCRCRGCTGTCRVFDNEETYGEMYRDLLLSGGFEEGDNDW